MPVFESTRKVQLFGSSLALTLPSLFVKANQVEKGSEMKVYFGLNGVLVACNVDESKVLKESLVEIIDKLEKKVKNEEGES